MGTTTFSGPIKAGTIKETTGTTVGTNVKNTGQVVMAQTHLIDVSGGAIAQSDTNVVLPAKSQIIDCVIDVVSAIGNAAAVLSLGTSGGNDNTILNGFTCATGGGAIGRKYPTTEAGATLGWSDIGDSDIRVTVKTTGASNAGSIRFTILYQQASDLS